MEKLLKKYIQTSLKEGLSFVIIIAAILSFVYISSGVYSVSQNEAGVLLRFGKIIDSNVSPGIHYKLPWPIDEITKVPVKAVRRILIQDFYDNSESQSTDNFSTSEPSLKQYALTGDNNIVELNCVIQYKILDPAKYLFNIKDNEPVLYETVKNVIIQSLAKTSVEEILTFGKATIETQIKMHAQNKLSNLNSGLSISLVELKNVRPPNVVQRYFDDVINSKIDKNKRISQAESYRNEEIPSAKGRANKDIQEAMAYKNEKVNQSQGQSQRFLSQLEEYKKSKRIGKENIYMEFLTSSLANVSEKYIIDRKDNKPVAKIKIRTKN
ncbi:MAG: FtsH protease activity modulator HflK [Pseudomonadota bacterium]